MAAITVTTQPPVDPETPTQTYYQQLVNEFMTVFDQMLAIIPKLEAAEALTAKSVRANLGVQVAFCASAINAVEQLPEMEAVKIANAERWRNRLQFIEAFRPLDDKVIGFEKILKHALRAVKSSLATELLQMYRIVRGHASAGKNPAAQAHVDVMKRDLARKTSTKAERAARKEQRIEDEVEQRIALRELEVKKAA
jgi:hypothetical protein